MTLKEVIQAFLSDIHHEDRTNLLCAMLRANLETKQTKVLSEDKFIDTLKDELKSQESTLIGDLRGVK